MMSFSLSLVLFAVCVRLSNAACPELIETNIPTTLNKSLLGVWNYVYMWGYGKGGRPRSDCYYFELLEATKHDVQSAKAECAGSGFDFDWDTAHMTMVSPFFPMDSVRLIAKSNKDIHTNMVYSCSVVSEMVVYLVSGSKEFAVLVEQSTVGLLSRHVPDKKEIDCLINSLDIIKNQTWNWSYEVCSNDEQFNV